MNRQGLLAALLLCAGLTGCLGTDATQSKDWLQSLRPSTGPTGPNALFIEYALIERPRGTTPLDGDIWTDADEQVVPLEARGAVEKAGYRVGRFGNVLPSGLQAMLSNPQTELGHRQRRLFFDADFKLALGKAIPQCELALPGDETEEPQVYRDAELALSITARKLGDDKISLEFVPEIQSSDKKGTAGLSLWAANKQSVKVAALAWKVTVGPDENLVIGMQPHREGTIGALSFASGEGTGAKQRILLLKAGRMEYHPKGLSMGKDPTPGPTKSLVNLASTALPHGAE